MTPDERAVLRQAVSELRDEHFPLIIAEGRPPVGCTMCYPADGSWPCVTDMIADDIEELL